MKRLIAAGFVFILLVMFAVYVWPHTCLMQRSGVETFVVDACPTQGCS